MLQIGPNPVEQQVIGIHFFDKLLAAKMLQRAQGTSGSNSSRSEERIQRGGQRADVVRAGFGYISNHVDTNRSQP